MSVIFFETGKALEQGKTTSVIQVAGGSPTSVKVCWSPDGNHGLPADTQAVPSMSWMPPRSASPTVFHKDANQRPWLSRGIAVVWPPPSQGMPPSL